MQNLMYARPQYALPSNPLLQTDTPQAIVGPDGSVPVSIFSYPGFFTLQDSEIINTYSIDFVSVSVIGQDYIANAVQQWVPALAANGEEILAYGLFQSTLLDVGIPQQVCFFGQCFTPPFAGTDVTSMLSYRFVVYTRPGGAAPMAMNVRGQVQLILALLLALVVIVAIIEMKEGNITWSTFKDFTHDIITAPGQIVSGALTGPLIALGITLVAASIILPVVISKASVGIPIGHGGHIEVGGELGSLPRAPAARAPRR